ncbi:MAG: AAA family ATPase [Pseudanabaenaceae cyanobacterium SKYGB_i_bin29]|nr:AAA family ATPase [Pseudanabaenaceae cyanobacterium SKYG29]MDW8421748.1 AAA family ATPase [Pseudanabaenaceae cyanobacterium SKYGB_i_bin29]
MKVVTVYHNKGGVGKTTTVVNLGAGLARRGYRVLLIDLDSQANTTYATGLAKSIYEEDDYFIANNFVALLENVYTEVKDVTIRASYSSFPVDVIPSHISTTESESELQAKDAALTQIRLRKKLESVSYDYDFVVIDTPPAIGLFARVALATCDYLIIPSDLRAFATQGLKNVINFMTGLNEFRQEVGRTEILVLGVLPSKIPTNPKFIEKTLPGLEEKVRQRYKLPLFETRIYERTELAKCLSNEVIITGETPEDIAYVPDPKSIFDYAPDSKSVVEFSSLVEEVLRKVK